MKSSKLITAVALLSLPASAVLNHTPEAMYRFVTTRLGWAINYAKMVLRATFDGTVVNAPNPSSSWENFLGTGTSEGWTFEEKMEAFDWYLAWLGTNDCTRLRLYEQDLIHVAIEQCELLSYTNSIDSLKALVRNPRGVHRDKAMEVVVRFAAVDDGMTQFIESIATNETDYTLGERGTSMYEYEQRLCGYTVTNAATTNAVKMFNRMKYFEPFCAVPCDIVFSIRIRGYAMSSNRLEYANWIFGNTNLQSNVIEYFTSVTNQLLSSGQPWPWINVGVGGN